MQQQRTVRRFCQKGDGTCNGTARWDRQIGARVRHLPEIGHVRRLRSSEIGHFSRVGRACSYVTRPRPAGAATQRVFCWVFARKQSHLALPGQHIHSPFLVHQRSSKQLGQERLACLEAAHQVPGVCVHGWWMPPRSIARLHRNVSLLISCEIAFPYDHLYSILYGLLHRLKGTDFLGNVSAT